jgi:hypothetical protein
VPAVWGSWIELMINDCVTPTFVVWIVSRSVGRERNVSLVKYREQRIANALKISIPRFFKGVLNLTEQHVKLGDLRNEAVLNVNDAGSRLQEAKPR